MFTNCVADALHARMYQPSVLSTEEFLAEIRRRAGVDAEVGRALGIPSSRTAELFAGKRRLRYDEAKILADRFMPEEGSAGAISEELLAKLLHALGPSVPKGGISESAAQALAEALTHALALLRETGANDPTDREFAMAVRAATTRFREASPS